MPYLPEVLIAFAVVVVGVSLFILRSRRGSPRSLTHEFPHLPLALLVAGRPSRASCWAPEGFLPEFERVDLRSRQFCRLRATSRGFGANQPLSCNRFMTPSSATN
jgi:hypothetical protein